MVEKEGVYIWCEMDRMFFPNDPDLSAGPSGYKSIQIFTQQNVVPVENKSVSVLHVISILQTQFFIGVNILSWVD